MLYTLGYIHAKDMVGIHSMHATQTIHNIKQSRTHKQFCTFDFYTMPPLHIQ